MEKTFGLWWFIIVSNLLDCPQTIAPFHGKHGRIIRGHVSPPLKGVTITLSSEQIGIITIVTDKDGIYRYLYYCCTIHVFTLCCHSYGPILSDLTVTVVCSHYYDHVCTILHLLLCYRVLLKRIITLLLRKMILTLSPP